MKIVLIRHGKTKGNVERRYVGTTNEGVLREELDRLKEYKWKKTSNLNLFEMVEDILNIDILKLDSYVKEQYRISKREINLKEE